MQEGHPCTNPDRLQRPSLAQYQTQKLPRTLLQQACRAATPPASWDGLQTAPSVARAYTSASLINTLSAAVVGGLTVYQQGSVAACSATFCTDRAGSPRSWQEATYANIGPAQTSNRRQGAKQQPPHAGPINLLPNPRPHQRLPPTGAVILRRLSCLSYHILTPPPREAPAAGPSSAASPVGSAGARRRPARRSRPGTGRGRPAPKASWEVTRVVGEGVYRPRMAAGAADAEVGGANRAHPSARHEAARTHVRSRGPQPLLSTESTGHVPASKTVRECSEELLDVGGLPLLPRPCGLGIVGHAPSVSTMVAASADVWRPSPQSALSPSQVQPNLDKLWVQCPSCESTMQCSCDLGQVVIHCPMSLVVGRGCLALSCCALHANLSIVTNGMPC